VFVSKVEDGTIIDESGLASNKVYVIHYNAGAANQKLTVRFTLDMSYDIGRVILHAATLQ
jgi:hypothetical protein